jgi:hypothetical protein
MNFVIPSRFLSVILSAPSSEALAKEEAKDLLTRF